MEVTKIKHKCGNVITLLAEITGHREWTYQVTGTKNPIDRWGFVICASCWKPVSLTRSMNAFQKRMKKEIHHDAETE